MHGIVACTFAVALASGGGCTSPFDKSTGTTSGCPQGFTECGALCCAPGTTCSGGACVYPYETADLYIYMCPSTANCALPKYFSLDNTCAPANAPAPGTCVDTGLQVAGSQSYGFSDCQACGSNCSSPVSLDTPRGFLSRKYAPGISLSCMGATCTPPPDCGGPTTGSAGSGGSSGGASSGGGSGSGGSSGSSGGSSSGGSSGSVGTANCTYPRATLAVNVSARTCGGCSEIAVIAESPQITAAIAAGKSPCTEGQLNGPTGCPMGQILIASFPECGGTACGPYTLDLSTEFNGATPITDTVSFCPFDDSGGTLTPLGTCVSSLVNQCDPSATITLIIN